MTIHTPIPWSEALRDRLYKFTHTHTQRALADVLGIRETTLSNHISNGTFPEKLLRRVADKCGVSYEQLVTGEGRLRPAVNEDGKPVHPVPGAPTPYDHPDVVNAIVALRRNPKWAPWVLGLLRILREGGPGRSHGITENIKAFLDSIDKETAERTGEEKVKLKGRG